MFTTLHVWYLRITFKNFERWHGRGFLTGYSLKCHTSSPPHPWGARSLFPHPHGSGGAGRHMTFQTGLAKACRLWWSKSYGSWLCLFTKGGCVTAYYFILFMMPITRPCLPRNLRNYLWMTKPQFRVKQIVTQALYQTLKTTKMNVKKLSG